MHQIRPIAALAILITAVSAHADDACPLSIHSGGAFVGVRTYHERDWGEGTISAYAEFHDDLIAAGYFDVAGGVHDILVAPIGFISDHMEVLYDLDIEARQLCESLGLPMARAKTVGVHPKFIGMIRELVKERTSAGERRALGSLGARADVCAEDCCPAPQRPASRWRARRSDPRPPRASRRPPRPAASRRSRSRSSGRRR